MPWSLYPVKNWQDHSSISKARHRCLIFGHLLTHFGEFLDRSFEHGWKKKPKVILACTKHKLD